MRQSCKLPTHPCSMRWLAHGFSVPRSRQAVNTDHREVQTREWNKGRRTYNHVMPSQPTAKKELKTNSSTALTTCAPLPWTLPSTARSTIVRHCPTAPKSMSFRRPTRSIRQIATREARKYSVPFAAAMIRDVTSERPRRWNNNV